MSQFGGGSRSPSQSSPTSPTITQSNGDQHQPTTLRKKRESLQSFTQSFSFRHSRSYDPPSSDSTPPNASNEKIPEAVVSRESPTPKRERGSRPPSMVFSYQPPIMEIQQDTLPELQPIFSYLNSHANKLYQEGYFLKLHDLDSRGRPSVDRVWSECFAQLVGTVLSLWDATQLDEAGEDGEVIPTFINLTDASIKMIESLPMNGEDGQNLQNVLSVSTAANNRYLLHFNSLHSLTQWTAGIRLAMFEHTTLQEAYTGSILAGKGKYLNNIKTILERSRYPTEDWARVRFGVGTPWRRCWCVITPPDEKEVAKAQKNLKKRSAYDRTPVSVTGTLKFYDTRKVTKKTKPIASINDAYAAYSIYPQSKALIDQSTLIKIEGRVNIHGPQETSTEGFVFIMPESHPAVTGFEIMLRFLIPVFDCFALYGRPSRLVADVTDVRSLMFALPNHRPYGYLELIDVSGLIHTDGSQRWNEREWRKQMKNLTSKRMNSGTGVGMPVRSVTTEEVPRNHHRSASSRSSVNFANKPAIRFGTQPTKSVPSSRKQSPQRGVGQTPSSSNDHVNSSPSRPVHQRAASDAASYRRVSPARGPMPPRSNPPAPPPHVHLNTSGSGNNLTVDSLASPAVYSASSASPYDSSHQPSPVQWPAGASASGTTPLIAAKAPVDAYPFAPVATPPAMAHNPSAQPPVRPAQMPEMRRANSAMDAATLAQLRAAQNRDGPPSDSNELPIMQTDLAHRSKDDAHVPSPSQDFFQDRYGNPTSSQGSTPQENPYFDQAHQYRQSRDSSPLPPAHGVSPSGSALPVDQPRYAQPPAYQYAPNHSMPSNRPSAPGGPNLISRRSHQGLPQIDLQSPNAASVRLPTIPGTPAGIDAIQQNSEYASRDAYAGEINSDAAGVRTSVVSRKPVPFGQRQ